MKSLILTFLAVLTLIIFYYIANADEIDDLVPFIIQVESGGNPHAISKASAIGLMQITPIVLKEWQMKNFDTFFSPFYRNIYELYDPKANIKVGTWYLRRLKDHYLKDDYTIERMLASYNGGITRMRRLLRQGKDWQDMPRESVRYVKKIMRLYRK